MILAMQLAGCGGDPHATAEAGYRAPPSRALEVITLERAVIDTGYQVPGQVIADDRVQIASRISGFIQDVPVREGDRVAVGDLLVAIDPSDVDGGIRRSEAALESARADLADARRDVAQFTTLLDQGGIAADTLRKARVRLSVAESRVAEAEAALHTARAQRRYTRIASPVDGVVVGRERQPGDLATPGSPILILESRHSLVFQTFVAQRHISKIEPGDAVAVDLDAPGERVAGRVLRVVPSGDPATRRYEVKISLPATGGLLPGMFGRANFRLGKRDALLAPEAAFIQRLGLDGVFTVDEAQIARFRWVRWRDTENGYREITAGLESGERVILEPPDDLSDGASVAAAVNAQRAVSELEQAQ